MPTENLEDRVHQVAKVLAEWNIAPIGEFDEGYGLYRISKILKPEFLKAWNELLAIRKMKKKAIEPLLIKTEIE